MKGRHSLGVAAALNRCCFAVAFPRVGWNSGPGDGIGD